MFVTNKLIRLDGFFPILVSVVDKCVRIVPFLICLLELNIVAVNGMKKLGETA